MGRYIVAITGASGVVYARRLVGVLVHGGHHVDLLITAAGFQVLAHETEWASMELDTRGGKGLAARCRAFFQPKDARGDVVYHPLHDFADDLASGSVAMQAMIVIPCTMGRVSSFATGRSVDLLDRAADVTLKEGRPLVVVPREAPLSLIHLRNLMVLAEAGAIILPASPGFYHHPRSLDDLVDFVVAKVLDRLGIAQDLVASWDQLKGG